MQKQLHILTLIGVLTFCSCETDSDLKLHNSSSYVLTALVYPDSAINVCAYKSVSYNNTDDYALLNNVYVALSINNANADTLPLPPDSYYVTFAQRTIEPDDEVKVELIDANQRQLCSATTTILSPVPIDHVRHSVQTLSGDTTQNITINIDEPSATTDYYQIKVRLHELFADGTEIIRPLDCDFYDYLFYIAKSTINVITSSMPDGVFIDEQINGRKTRISFRIEQRYLLPTQSNSELTLEILLYRHTYDYYNFLLTSYMAKEYLILPVFGVSSVYSNVENGVGIVSGMAVSKYELKLYKDELDKEHIILL